MANCTTTSPAPWVQYGAQALYRPSAGDLDDYLVGPKASYLAAAVQTSGATVVLAENSAEGKEIAARLGIKLGAGVITDVVGVEPDGTAHKSVLAGSYTSTAKATTPVAVLTVKPNSITPEPAVTGTAPATTTIEVPETATAASARITARNDKPASGRPDLTEARIVVAGGRGVDGDFGPLEELADALGAAVGASRAATDAGWIGHDAQVGQTGKTVSPAAVHFRRDLRRHPAKGRHADGQGHCRGEQGRRVAGFRDRGLRHRGRPLQGAAAGN